MITVLRNCFTRHPATFDARERQALRGANCRCVRIYVVRGVERGLPYGAETLVRFANNDEIENPATRAVLFPEVQRWLETHRSAEYQLEIREVDYYYEGDDSN